MSNFLEKDRAKLPLIEVAGDSLAQLEIPNKSSIKTMSQMANEQILKIFIHNDNTLIVGTNEKENTISVYFVNREDNNNPTLVVEAEVSSKILGAELLSDNILRIDLEHDSPIFLSNELNLLQNNKLITRKDLNEEAMRLDRKSYDLSV